ncbi:hypothetical protein QNO07_13875 [Streptomyces sp. 549]|uniref:hypothetical protein n=1 Tax=Streptomyces sp. 549 TaxID=3049076 RepID=UPI0024C307B6|nr:hypothetical protein [Streptomyces sp. 549]MDK1474493.1 hypothetical protein [Streptomyces sp. 549]
MLNGLGPGAADADVLAVDLDDPASLDRFAECCGLVVNCAWPPDRTPALRTRDSYELSGFVTALTALRVLEGATAPGVHFAADVLDATSTVSALEAEPAVELLAT